MAHCAGLISNPVSKGVNLPETGQNNKESGLELESALSAETCRELFDTLAQWKTFLENHAPYFQNQSQELGLRV